MIKLLAISGFIFTMFVSSPTDLSKSDDSNKIESFSFSSPENGINLFDFEVSDDDTDKKKEKYKSIKDRKISRRLVYIFGALWVVIAAIMFSNS